MDKLLKIGHLIGLAVFLGSIPGHILLGKIVEPVADPAGFALLMHAKHVNVQVLTLPGLVLMLITGVALMLRRGLKPARERWLAVKLVLVVLVALNGMLILGPASRDIATATRSASLGGASAANIAVLERRESLFGALNLVMILGAIGLVVAKPALRRMSGSKADPRGTAP